MPAMGALVDDHNPLTGEVASGEIMDGINFRHIGNKVCNTIAKVIRVMGWFSTNLTHLCFKAWILCDWHIFF